jgi:hypothetical protein
MDGGTGGNLETQVGPICAGTKVWPAVPAVPRANLLSGAVLLKGVDIVHRFEDDAPAPATISPIWAPLGYELLTVVTHYPVPSVASMNRDHHRIKHLSILAQVGE